LKNYSAFNPAEEAGFFNNKIDLNIIRWGIINHNIGGKSYEIYG